MNKTGRNFDRNGTATALNVFLQHQHATAGFRHVSRCCKRIGATADNDNIECAHISANDTPRVRRLAYEIDCRAPDF